MREMMPPDSAGAMGAAGRHPAGAMGAAGRQRAGPMGADAQPAAVGIARRGSGWRAAALRDLRASKPRGNLRIR